MKVDPSPVQRGRPSVRPSLPWRPPTKGSFLPPDHRFVQQLLSPQGKKVSQHVQTTRPGSQEWCTKLLGLCKGQHEDRRSLLQRRRARQGAAKAARNHREPARYGEISRIGRDGRADGLAGIRKWLEDRGHTYVVTDDKEGANSTFDKELVDAGESLAPEMSPGRQLTILKMSSSPHLSTRATSPRSELPRPRT